MAVAYAPTSRTCGFSLTNVQYVMGGSQDKRYNLSFIVENSVEIGKPFIGVSINYRLSAWGFLDSHEVRSEGITNLGIRDQRLALQWLQENIGTYLCR